MKAENTYGVAEQRPFTIDLFYQKGKRLRPNFLKIFYDTVLCKQYYVNYVKVEVTSSQKTQDIVTEQP